MIKLKSLIVEGNETKYINILKQKISDLHEDFKRDFFNHLISALKNEPNRLSNPKYNEWLSYNGKSPSMMSRIQDFDKEFDIESISSEELYNKMNDPKSPIRNGLILVNQYIRAEEKNP